MSPYEKCLFWWTEVNLFGLEFEERFPPVPFLRIKSDKLLAGDLGVLEGLVEHMEFLLDERRPEQTRRKVDRWNHRTDRDLRPDADPRPPCGPRHREPTGLRHG